MRPRLDALLAFEKVHGREHFAATAGDALHYAFLNGPLERGRFVAFLGVAERTGRRTLAALLEYGLLSSESPKGRVSFQVPLPALRFLFPALWPEAEAEASGMS